jgi:hypothetical protein
MCRDGTESGRFVNSACAIREGFDEKPPARDRHGIRRNAYQFAADRAQFAMTAGRGDVR